MQLELTHRSHSYQCLEGSVSWGGLELNVIEAFRFVKHFKSSLDFREFLDRAGYISQNEWCYTVSGRQGGATKQSVDVGDCGFGAFPRVRVRALHRFPREAGTVLLRDACVCACAHWVQPLKETYAMRAVSSFWEVWE